MDLDRYLPSIAAGDAEAFGSWLSHAEEPLRRSLRSFASRVDTEAVLQEGLLRVWQVAPKVSISGENSLLRVAFRIVRNAAIDAVRRARKQVVEADLSEWEQLSVGPVEPDPMLYAAIVECRDALPERPRLAFALRVEDEGGHSDRALAERAGMTLNTFLKNFGRARQFLADCLENKGVDWQRGLR